VEKHCAHIIQMTIQCEQASPSLVVPDLNLVIITSGHKQGLGRVEINASDWAIVFFESVNESSHAVVPQLDSGRVERNENPWPVSKSVQMLRRVGVPPRNH
jgi:hypothetical protein